MGQSSDNIHGHAVMQVTTGEVMPILPCSFATWWFCSNLEQHMVSMSSRHIVNCKVFQPLVTSSEAPVEKLRTAATSVFLRGCRGPKAVKLPQVLVVYADVCML
jgi:hypothetical protein